MYPTLEQIEKADRYQLCYWHRFLPSPGAGAIGTDEFQEVLHAECVLMDLIHERWKEAGGFTPAISKLLGWVNKYPHP